MKQYLHFICIVLISNVLSSCDGQKADPDFSPAVQRPSVTKGEVKILFDEAHNNIHTTDGTYRPFVELLENDGYRIDKNKDPFSGESLQGYYILVISNPKGKERKYDPAFTEEECSAVEEWVRSGGNLLLIADHHPIGSAAEILGKRFGVSMSKGFTNDSVYFDSSSFTHSQVNGKSQLVFSRANGLLLDHPITLGRDSTERIERIITFTGQSLSGPEGSAGFLKLSSTATDVIPDSIWEEPDMIFFTNTFTRFADPVSAAGRYQGIALEFGKGRVVVMGEAAMLTAQVAGEEKFGMQVTGIDNKQLALNIVHWLSRLL
ncbi:MAG: DUF4350 domain-containing protein [Ignavibacteriales bacterium]|nr:DUF4350 domain-containing protein [Ignavibacteriales bacterium]